MSQQVNKPYVIWIYPGNLGSVLDASTWLKTVSELRNFGWRVTLVSVGPNGCHYIHGVKVLCVSRPEVYLLRHAIYHLKVVQIILKQFESLDIILLHEISAPWILPLRLFRKLIGRRRPLMVTDTRSLPMSQSSKETWKEKIRRSAYRLETHMSNLYSDGRLAITSRMADAVGIPTEKLWGVWPSGAEIELISRARSIRKWSLDSSVHLIYHGTLHHERNLMILSQAVVRANSQGMSFNLSLVGDGTERAELEDFAARSNGCVRVIRFVAYEKIPDILSDAHIGVLPFPNEEKFRVSSPIKLFEYMAAGLPILATRIVCHTDVIGDGDYAFWAEDSSEQGLLNALCEIWQSRYLLPDKGAHAAMAAEIWSWKASARKLKVALEAGIAQTA